MTLHSCKPCKFSTTKKCGYDRHLLTTKHVNNVKTDENIEKTILINKIEDLTKKVEELQKSNQELKDTNNQNTNKIVKEAR